MEILHRPIAAALTTAVKPTVVRNDLTAVRGLADRVFGWFEIE